MKTRQLVRRAGWVFPAVAAAVFVGDQVVKRQARRLKDGEKRMHARDMVVFRNCANRGAAMNIGQNYPAAVKAAALAVTALLTAVYVLTLGLAGRRTLKLGLSLLLGGAWSNVYDRLRRGYVTDYVSFDIGVPDLKDMVFNLGDFGIMVGALLIVLRAA